MRHFYFSLLFLFVGCSTPSLHHPQSIETKVVERLTALHTAAPRQEIDQLAHDIVIRVDELNRVFDRTTSPKWHNFLVIVGVKKQGLCYHYADGLYIYLITYKADYPHFAFHLIGANIGSYWREHNALAIVPKGETIDDGIIVDAWRETGGLFVAPIHQDTRYRWIHRTDRGCP